MPAQDFMGLGQPIRDLAQQYTFDAPPADAGWAARGSFLHARLDEAATVAGAVLEAMPASAPDPAAVESIGDLLGALATRAIEYIKSGAVLMPASEALKVARDALAAAVLAGYHVAATGAGIYAEPEARAHAFLEAAHVKQAEVLEDYRARLGIAQAIIYLANSGVLDLLLDHPGDETGQAVQPWLIVAALIAVVALAFIVVHFYEVRDRTERWRLSCLDADGNVIPEYRALCVQLLGKEEPPGGAFDSIAKAAPWVLGGAVVLYFLTR